MEDGDETQSWPARAVLLLVLGGLAGFVFSQLIRGDQPWRWTDDPLRVGAAALIASAGIAFAFTLERRRWLWSAGFALAVGLVVGGVSWRNGSWSSWGSNEGWQLFAALLTVTIAVPLFQTVRDAGRPRLDYETLHAHSWTDGILLGAAGAFVLISFLMALLLGQLFALIGLRFVEHLIDKPWFDWTLAGAAFGAGVGLLRERERVLVTLHRVVTAIASVLAPLFALGLLFFVAALPFTGLGPLWSETKQTTPILLLCVLGAFVLANATIGASADEEARGPVLRHAALALGAVMLPLALVAAVSIQKRVAQYGLTPDRLWAVTVVAIAVAGSLLYFATIVRWRLGWAKGARRVNIGLAVGICALAFLLALPIVSFGSISTSNQLWRLRTGRVAPDKVDWRALRFDFGPSGVEALRNLQRSGPATVRDLAGQALAMKTRYPEPWLQEPAEMPVLKTVPAGVAVPPALRAAIMPGPKRWPDQICSGAGDCFLYWKPGETTAIVLMQQARCADQTVVPKADCPVVPHVMRLDRQGWQDVNDRSGLPVVPESPAEERAALQHQQDALARGDVEIREVKRRQVFVGGRPVGDVFE